MYSTAVVARDAEGYVIYIWENVLKLIRDHLKTVKNIFDDILITVQVFNPRTKKQWRHISHN